MIIKRNSIICLGLAGCIEINTAEVAGKLKIKISGEEATPRIRYATEQVKASSR